MRGKALLIVGIAIGYVLGARAGRGRYEDIKRAAGKLWGSPTVQHQVKNAEDFAKDKAPEVIGFLSDGAKKVVSQVSGKPATPAKKPVRTTPAKSTSSSTTDSE